MKEKIIIIRTSQDTQGYASYPQWLIHRLKKAYLLATQQHSLHCIWVPLIFGVLEVKAKHLGIPTDQSIAQIIEKDIRARVTCLAWDL